MNIPEGYAQITHVFFGVNYPHGAVTTFGVTNTSDQPADGLAAFYHGLWADNIMPRLGSSTVLGSTICKLGPNDVGPSAEFSSAVAGGVSLDTGAPSVAILVQKRTALGGKANRGRFYVPGLPELQTDQAGFINGANLDNLQASFDDWYEAATEFDDTPVVLHAVRKDNAVPPQPLPIQPTPVAITSVNVEQLCATQRRRLRR